MNDITAKAKKLIEKAKSATPGRWHIWRHGHRNEAIAVCDGNKTRAAQYLGIGKKTFHEWKILCGMRERFPPSGSPDDKMLRRMVMAIDQGN